MFFWLCKYSLSESSELNKVAENFTVFLKHQLSCYSVVRPQDFEIVDPDVSSIIAFSKRK